MHHQLVDLKKIAECDNMGLRFVSTDMRYNHPGVPVIFAGTFENQGQTYQGKRVLAMFAGKSCSKVRAVLSSKLDTVVYVCGINGVQGNWPVWDHTLGEYN